MNPLELEIAADFLIYFMKGNGLAILIAVPAVAFLIFTPSNWRD